MRRVFGDALISICAVLALLITLVSVDTRVRDQVSGVWTGTPSSTLSTIGGQAHAVASIVFDALRDHSIANAPLMIFALAAAVLVLFMLRT